MKTRISQISNVVTKAYNRKWGPAIKIIKVSRKFLLIVEQFQRKLGQFINQD